MIIINNQVNFFSVLTGNIRCFFCGKKNCYVRYYPGRRKVSYVDGTRIVKTCPKDRNRGRF